MNILSCLENDYRGKMTDGQKFKDSRIETNIVMVTSVPKFSAGSTIQPVGGTKGDGITNTQEFLKDVNTHMIKLLTVEVLGDKPEIITFNVILGSNVPPILAVTICHPNTECTQQWRNQTRSTLRTYTLPTVTYSFDS